MDPTRRDLLLQVRCAVYNGTLGSGFGSGSTRPLLYTHKWHWQPDPQVLDSPVAGHRRRFGVPQIAVKTCGHDWTRFR